MQTDVSVLRDEISAKEAKAADITAEKGNAQSINVHISERIIAEAQAAQKLCQKQ